MSIGQWLKKETVMPLREGQWFWDTLRGKTSLRDTFGEHNRLHSDATTELGHNAATENPDATAALIYATIASGGSAAGGAGEAGGGAAGGGFGGFGGMGGMGGMAGLQGLMPRQQGGSQAMERQRMVAEQMRAQREQQAQEAQRAARLPGWIGEA